MYGYQPSKGILIKMVLRPMTLELEAQCQELKWEKREQCGQRGMAPTVCSATGTVIRGTAISALLLACSWDCLCWWSGPLTNKGYDLFMCLLCLEFHWCQFSETGLWTWAVIQFNGQSCLQRGKGEKGLCTELEASQYLIHNTPHHWST